jgi:hypothetical protein
MRTLSRYSRNDSLMFLIPEIIANLKLPFIIDPGEHQATCVVTAQHFSGTPSIRSASGNLVKGPYHHLAFRRFRSYDQQQTLGTGSTRLAPNELAMRTHEPRIKIGCSANWIRNVRWNQQSQTPTDSQPCFPVGGNLVSKQDFPRHLAFPLHDVTLARWKRHSSTTKIAILAHRQIQSRRAHWRLLLDESEPLLLSIELPMSPLPPFPPSEYRHTSTKSTNGSVMSRPPCRPRQPPFSNVHSSMCSGQLCLHLVLSLW